MGLVVASNLPARDELRHSRSGCDNIGERCGNDVLVILEEAALTEYLNLLGNAIVDRSPDELIGAVAIALTISLGMAGLYCIGRRKITENLLPIIALMIVANLLSMAVGAGYFQLARKKMGYVTREAAWRPPGGPGGSCELLTQRIFQEADRNHDRRISKEEASLAAVELLRRADANGTGSIDPVTLFTVLQAATYYGRDPDHPPSTFGRSGSWTPEFSIPGSRPIRSPERMSPPSEDTRTGSNPPKDPAEVMISPNPDDTRISSHQRG
jgi:hypothetical protein